MALSHRVLSSIAALGLIVTAAATGTPAPVASADPLPDIVLKYDGINIGAGGEIDMAYSIASVGAPVAGVSLSIECNYRFKAAPNNVSGSVQSKDAIGQPQGVPVPKLVVCHPSSADQYVSSIIVIANQGSPDATPANNTVTWDAASKLPKPDVKVAYMARQTNAQGWVKALFAITDTLADAPDVKLHATCTYHSNATKLFSSEDDQQLGTISLQKNQNAVAEWVTCPAKAGQYVSSVFLTADVQKPWTDASTTNNTSYWERATMG